MAGLLELANHPHSAGYILLQTVRDKSRSRSKAPTPHE
jgi:hypothetical protein